MQSKAYGNGAKLIEICLDFAHLKNSLDFSIPKVQTCINWAAQAIKCNPKHIIMGRELEP
jgi:hypothetical protein